MIAVKDLVIRYAPDLPDVLHGVTFSLRGQERVGLLGRTGSGKSTLAMSILRFVSGVLLVRAVLSFTQVDPVEGSIAIDGIDITKIGLYDLRSRLVSTFKIRHRVFTLNLAADVYPAGCEYANFI
jgi:ABC-type multidrug transport system fused ATPase/permease subunit